MRANVLVGDGVMLKDADKDAVLLSVTEGDADALGDTERDVEMLGKTEVDMAGDTEGDGVAVTEAGPIVRTVCEGRGRQGLTQYVERGGAVRESAMCANRR